MPTALLLPGMTLNSTAFPDLPVHTISIDFNDLVLGPAGETPDLAERRMAVYVDLLDRRLGERAEWDGDRRIVVAHSFGGMLALAWWLAHGGAGPARIQGMVLVSTSAGPMFDVVRLRLFGAGGLELRVPLSQPIRLWNLPAVTRRVKQILSGEHDRPNQVDFRTLEHPNDWSMDRAGWQNTDWRAMRSYRLAMDGFDVRNRLGEIDVPVIVLHGTHDTLLPLKAARELADRIPGATLRVIEGAGHALPLTHGEEIQRAVGDLPMTGDR